MALAALCLGWSARGADASDAETAGSHAQGQQQWVRDFPLWMGVPVKDFAVLDEGTVRQRRWGAYAYRGHGPEAEQRPCIEIGALYYGGGRGGSFQDGSACGPLAPPASEPVLNQSGFTIKKSFHGPTVSDTVIAIAVASDVARVRVELSPGPSQTRATRLLSRGQAQKAHLRQFRYLAFGVARDVCVTGIAGFDADGARLFQTPDQRRCE